MNDEMYIIVRDIKEHTRWMNAAAVGGVAAERGGVCPFLGILAGSWGLTRWYANQIQSLVEVNGQRFVDPAGEHPGKSALDHGRTAYRQAIERVKEIYDRAFDQYEA